MLEGLLESILQKLFGEYVEDLDCENLHFGVYFPLLISSHNNRSGREMCGWTMFS